MLTLFVPPPRFSGLLTLSLFRSLCLCCVCVSGPLCLACCDPAYTVAGLGKHGGRCWRRYGNVCDRVLRWLPSSLWPWLQGQRDDYPVTLNSLCHYECTVGDTRYHGGPWTRLCRSGFSRNKRVPKPNDIFFMFEKLWTRSFQRHRSLSALT